ncbi:MAG: ATP-binding protein [Desulfobacterales bacterium]
MLKSKIFENPYYRSLTRKMVLTVIIVSFMPMILIAGLILNEFRKSYTEKVDAHLKEVVLKHKQNIDTFLKEKTSDIRFLVKTFGIEQLSDELFLAQRLYMLQEEHGPVFVDLGVVNEQGHQIAYAGPFKLGKANYSEAEWFQNAIQNKFFISDVFLGLRGLPHFIISIKQKAGEEDWILRATVDFVAFNTLVENVRIGETGFATILNRKGEFQTKPPPGITHEKDIYKDLLGKKIENLDGILISRRKDDSGIEYIYVSSFLKNGEWTLVYRQNTSDAFLILKQTQRLALLICVIGGIGIITMAYLLSRRMVNRIARADLEKEMMNQQVIETGKLASVGELAAGIAHEINNPVAIMVEEAGWIQDLLEEEEFSESKNLEEFERALKQINTQGKRCKEITHKLLSFARKTDSTTQEIHVKELIQEIIELTGQRAKYSNVIIETSFQENLPSFRASNTEMQQIFLNLINNAIDAMEKTGGTVNIKVSLEPKDIVVEVADNGPGIPQANLARIFDPFFTTKPVGKGTGLGLSICYGIIKKIGGEIHVKSVVGLGTTFRVYFPVGTNG